MKTCTLKNVVLTSLVFLSSTSLSWAMDEGVLTVEESGASQPSPARMRINIGALTSARNSGDESNGGDRSVESAAPALYSPRNSSAGGSPKISQKSTRSHRDRASSRSFLGAPKVSKESEFIRNVVELDPDHMTPRTPDRRQPNSPPKKISPKDLKNKEYDKGLKALEQTLAKLQGGDPNTVKKGFERALDSFELAKKQGFPLASHKLGEVEVYLGMLHLPESFKTKKPPTSIADLEVIPKPEVFFESLRYFKLSSEEQDFNGTVWYARLSCILGEIYRSNGDVGKAKEHFLTAARLNQPDAQHSLACLLTDPQEQIKWLRKAARNGNVPSFFPLGNLLFEQTVFGAEAFGWLNKVEGALVTSEQQEKQKEYLDVVEKNYKKGLSLMRDSNFNGAVESFLMGRILGHIPSSYALAKCYELLDKNNEALPVYRQLATQGEEEAQCIYAQLVEKTNPKEAEQFYVEAVESEYLLAYFDFGQFLLTKKRIHEAEALFQSLTYKIRDLVIDGHMRLAELCEELKDAEKHRSWTAAAENLKKKTWYEHFETVDEEAEKWSSEEVQKHQKSEVIFHNPVLYFFNQGMHFVDEKNIERATHYFRIFFANLRSLAGQAFANIGLIKETEDHTVAAMAHFQVAAVLGHPNAQHRLAQYLEKQRDKSAKIWHERAALQGVVEAAIDRAFIAQDKKDMEGAEIWYRKALELDPKSTQALVNLGLLLHDKNPDEEERLFHEAADLEDPKALSLLGDIFLKRGETSKAKEYYKRAYKKGRASAAFRLARIIEKENTLEAMKWDRKAADLNYPKALFNLGRYFEVLGRKDLAADYYGKILETYPQAKKRLGLLLIHKNELEMRKIGFSYLEEVVAAGEDAEAYFELGVYLCSSYTKESDIKTGLEYYKKSAQLGYNDAFSRLYKFADLLEKSSAEGKDILIATLLRGKHKEEAYSIYLFIIEKAPKGLSNIAQDARYRVGRLMFESGRKQEGRKYLNEAASEGHEDAHKFLDSLEEEKV